MKRTTKFPASLWLLTGVGECLFDLSPEDLETFKLLAAEYWKDTAHAPLTQP